MNDYLMAATAQVAPMPAMARQAYGEALMEVVDRLAAMIGSVGCEGCEADIAEWDRVAPRLSELARDYA